MVWLVASCVALVNPLWSQTLEAFDPAPNGPVYALAVQTDGRILVGGDFSNLGTQTRWNIGRLEIDGTLDAAFDPLGGDSVFALALQTDGRILVGGIFPTMGNQPRSRLARINADGSLEGSFNPGANADVYALALQPDGRIVVGGAFTDLGGAARTYLGRLNADGSRDLAFKPAVSGTVYSLAIQRDGKIMVGGAFTSLGGQSRRYLGRLNSDGSLDTAFDSPASDRVRCLLVQPDGKILVGGQFTTLKGQNRPYLGRLNTDGTLDTAFSPAASGPVYSIALQADGKILAGGSFVVLGGQPRSHIGRLNADGTVDPSLNPGANGNVYTVALQTDGSILAGGDFGTFAGQPRRRLARMMNTYPAIQGLAFNGSSIRWLRGGASPEVWRTEFEFSTNGGSWTSLGDGSPIPGGWEVAGGSMPANATVLARGFVAAGYEAGSGWFVEAGIGRPAIRSQPASLSNSSAAPAKFNVVAAGAAPLIYQWLKDDVPLQDEGRISGTQSPTLVVSNVSAVDVGGYRVVITNSYGSETSLVATLTVTAPSLTSQPANRTNNAGTTATFAIQPIGTPPLTCQWYVDGASLNDGGDTSGAHTPTLVLSNVLRGNAANYWAVITNAFGSVTSSVASLTVIDPFISISPVNLTNSPGTAAVFNVMAAGTTPLNYQWLKNGLSLEDGEKIAGTHTPMLTLSNVLGGEAGAYAVVVANAFGSVTSPVAFLSVKDPFIIAHPGSQFANAGQTVLFNLGVAGTAPFSYQWRKDGVPLGGATAAWLGLTNVQWPDRGGYDVLVSNNFGGVTSSVANLTLNLAVPDSFNASADGIVRALALQADGKILVGGDFSLLNGQPRSHLGRLLADGSLDMGFNPGADGTVNCFAVQSDGKVLVGGQFSNLSGQTRNYIGRLKADGSLDTAFNPGAQGWVFSIGLQSDGGILLGGSLSAPAWPISGYLVRHYADGTLDPTLNLVTSDSFGAVRTTAFQPDGRILMGGTFSFLTGPSLGNQMYRREGIARLNADGTVDGSYQASATGLYRIDCMAVQADRKLVVGGWFYQLNGQACTSLGRLNPDGTFDTPFNMPFEADIESLAIQTDGKIMVGRFGVRLNGDGSPDTGFNLAKDGVLYCWAIQPDGKILLGGDFSVVAGQAHSHIARLNNTAPATNGLAYSGSTVTWLRGGTSPEVWRTTLEWSPDGLNWTSLGAGLRVAEGWQWSGVSLPAIAALRARGFLTGAAKNGSAWFAENLRWTVPVFATEMDFGFRTNRFGVALNGLVGRVIVVEASSNLVQWTPVLTNGVPTSGVVFFTDPDSDGLPHRFYRAHYAEDK